MGTTMVGTARCGEGATPYRHNAWPVAFRARLRRAPPWRRALKPRGRDEGRERDEKQRENISITAPITKSSVRRACAAHEAARRSPLPAATAHAQRPCVERLRGNTAGCVPPCERALLTPSFNQHNVLRTDRRQLTAAAVIASSTRAGRPPNCMFRVKTRPKQCHRGLHRVVRRPPRTP